MMIFDRQKQRLLLEGKEYTPGDIHGLVAEGEGNHPSAIWDLYLFLNEWFNDDPVITVHTSGSTGPPFVFPNIQLTGSSGFSKCKEYGR